MNKDKKPIHRALAKTFGGLFGERQKRLRRIEALAEKLPHKEKEELEKKLLKEIETRLKKLPYEAKRRLTEQLLKNIDIKEFLLRFFDALPEERKIRAITNMVAITNMEVDTSASKSKNEQIQVMLAWREILVELARPERMKVENEKVRLVLYSSFIYPAIQGELQNPAKKKFKGRSQRNRYEEIRIAVVVRILRQCVGFTAYEAYRLVGDVENESEENTRRICSKIDKKTKRELPKRAKKKD